MDATGQLHWQAEDLGCGLECSKVVGSGQTLRELRNSQRRSTSVCARGGRCPVCPGYIHACPNGGSDRIGAEESCHMTG